MTDPYRPSPVLPLPRIHPSPGFLLLVAVVYGGCGALASVPMAILQDLAQACGGGPGFNALPASLFWTLGVVLSATIPVLTYTRFGVQAGPSPIRRAALGAGTVALVVVTTMVCWAMAGAYFSWTPARLELVSLQTLTDALDLLFIAGMVGATASPLGVIIGLVLIPSTTPTPGPAEE